MNIAFLLFALHLPERRMFNEFYAKDTSRKIRAVFKAKGQSGKPLSTNPPYGYVKDPEDKTHWLVDEKAAEVIREIFRLCIQGYGVYTSTEGMQYLFPGMDQGFWESNAQTLQESISYLTSEYLNESTQDYSHSPCQWTFHKSSHYLYGAETAASYDSSRDNDEISIWAPIGNGEDGRYRIVTISRRDQKDYKLNNVSYMATNSGPLMIDYALYRAEKLRTDRPTEEQIEEAVHKAQTILEQIGLGTWKVAFSAVETSPTGNVVEYMIRLTAVPVFQGVAAIHRPQLGNLKSDTVYASNYYLTEATFGFSADGTLIGNGSVS